MKRLSSLVLLVTALLFAPAVLAAGQATPDEAKAMAIEAVEYLKSVGPAKAFPEFTAKDNRWHDRDLYVNVVDSKGMVVAHGNNPGLIGHSVLTLKDVTGKPFIQDFMAVKDAAWVDYKWQNPVTQMVEPKTVYVVRFGDYVVGVGAYAQ